MVLFLLSPSPKPVLGPEIPRHWKLQRSFKIFLHRRRTGRGRRSGSSRRGVTRCPSRPCWCSRRSSGGQEEEGEENVPPQRRKKRSHKMILQKKTLLMLEKKLRRSRKSRKKGDENDSSSEEERKGFTRWSCSKWRDEFTSSQRRVVFLCLPVKS